MKDIVIVQSEEVDGNTLKKELDRVLDLQKAYNDELISVEPAANETEMATISSEAPNIALNVSGTILQPCELWSWTIIGAALQLFTIAFPAVATYHFKWLRKGVVVPRYAYWCFLSGTFALIISLLICGHIIEASTTEYKFSALQNRNTKIRRILRLQMDCTVGSQHFPSVAILNESQNTFIRSRLNQKKFK